MKYIWFILFIHVSLSVFSAEPELYREEYRPQYHFTPASRWIGDPCGTVIYNGKYMAYSWGAAVSDDLVHWTELNNHAIKGLPENISSFTGSVVVDKKDTSGYGKGALIAAFTSFDENSKKQSQSIAFSHDGGVTYQYYDLNPVIDIWSTEFRDPTVIWDEKSGRWVMLVAKALEKKVAFYGSDDLKHWEWLSEFGPMGDSEKSWECPDMFRLPVEGSNEKKWVLVLSVNWSDEQYFVGDFDGVRFIPDRPDASPLYVDSGLDYYASRVFQNFDDENSDDVYTIGWMNTWDYANAAPSAWGKGIWSVPRKLSLYDTADGLRLRQKPVEALTSLRQSPFRFSKRLNKGFTKLPRIGEMENVYEMNLELHVGKGDVAGVNLCVGDGRKVTVSYDSDSQYLTVDRTNSTVAEMPKFDRIAYSRIPSVNGTINLTILADKSTLEIFVNDGEKVFSLLTYASEGQDGVELFSLRGNSGVDITTWQLNTIWK